VTTTALEGPPETGPGEADCLTTLGVNALLCDRPGGAVLISAKKSNPMEQEHPTGQSETGESLGGRKESRRGQRSLKPNFKCRIALEDTDR